MAKYFLSNKAIEDISKIWDYTYTFWSKDQANKYYLVIIETCQKLASNPEVGKIYPELSENILGFGVGKHILIYRIHRDNEIEIIRILHERMNLAIRIEED
jgi:toxin ParE1/3/4